MLKAFILQQSGSAASPSSFMVDIQAGSMNAAILFRYSIPPQSFLPSFLPSYTLAKSPFDKKLNKKKTRSLLFAVDVATMKQEPVA